MYQSRMKSLLLSFMIISLLISILSTNQNAAQGSTSNIVVVKKYSSNDYLTTQSKVDAILQKELKHGYPFSKPFVKLNPYGNSPLSAVVIFSTVDKTKVKMTVKGHDTSVDIKNTFPLGTKHVLPIYGLYSGEENQVELILDDGSIKIITIKTSILKSVLKRAKVLTNVKGEVVDGLTFCDPANAIDNIYSMAYDSNGDIRWYFKEKGNSLPSRRLKNGRILTQTVNLLDGNYYSVGVREMDLIGKVYREYVVPGGQHHDHYEMPNGNFIICGNEINFSTREDIAYEISRKTGKVLRMFDMKEILNQKDGNSFNQNDKDWFHMNSVAYNQATNTIMFSGRNIDAVVGINYKTKKLKWILGTSEGWLKTDKKKFFKPVGTGFQWQYAQHAADFLSNGDIILFDNGSYRAKKTNPEAKVSTSNNYSRGVRYRINTKDMTVRQIWQFGKKRGSDWYSSFISDIDYAGNDTYIMTSGALLTTSKIAKQAKTIGVKRTADVVEVKNSKIVFELLVNTYLYRSERMPFYTTKNTYDINVKGVYLGSYGKLPSVNGVRFDKYTARSANFKLNVSMEYGRVGISGSWNSTSSPREAYAVIVNQRTGGSYIKRISDIPGGLPNQKFYVMISSSGRSDSYKLFIVAGGMTYKTKYLINF